MNYPIQKITPMPNGAPKPFPRIQHEFQNEPATAKQIRESRQSEVKKQFLKCWNNYRQRAWMHDEMTPIAGGATDDLGGWATTLIDSLDTLWIMGARDEFISAIKDVEAIDFGYTNVEKINMFETNIRHLGGLLSAYDLSRQDRLLNKAKELGEMLYHAFDTPNNMPLTRWDFQKAGQGEKQEAEANVLIAELASFSLEFVRLSQATGDPKWFDAAYRVLKLLEKDQMKTRLPGMWPIVVNPRRLDLTQDTGFSLGSMVRNNPWCGTASSRLAHYPYCDGTALGMNPFSIIDTLLSSCRRTPRMSIYSRRMHSLAVSMTRTRTCTRKRCKLRSHIPCIVRWYQGIQTCSAQASFAQKKVRPT